VIKTKGFSTFDQLKTTLVGDVFSIDKFRHLKENKILSPLSKVLDETKEDLEKFCSTLKSCGVEVLRPNMDIKYDDLSSYNRKPPLQTRDDMAVIGENIYIANNLPEYQHIFDQIPTEKKFYPEKNFLEKLKLKYNM